MTEKPTRSRDAFIALRIDDYYEAVRDIRHESPELTERLRNLFIEITLAIVTTGRPLSADDRIAAVSVMRSISTYRAQQKRLVALGLVYQAEGGGWLTRLAEAEFSRRAARLKSGAEGFGNPVDKNGEGSLEGSLGGAARGAARHPLISKNDNDFNGGASPSSSSLSPNNNNYLSHSGPRAQEVSAEMRNLVAEHVGSNEAVMLVREFEAWGGYASAKDKDAVFRSFCARRGIHITTRALRSARSARH